MTDVSGIEILDAYVGEPGVYIEKGIFRRGRLRSWHRDTLGLIELMIDFEEEGALAVSSEHVRIADGAAQAGGYVSWAWIYDPATIGRIDEVLTEHRGEAAGTLDPYRIARSVLEPMYARVNGVRMPGDRPEA